MWLRDLHAAGLGHDLFKGHEGLSGLHSPGTAPEAGVLVEADEALLETLVLDGA